MLPVAQRPLRATTSVADDFHLGDATVNPKADSQRDPLRHVLDVGMTTRRNYPVGRHPSLDFEKVIQHSQARPSRSGRPG